MVGLVLGEVRGLVLDELHDILPRHRFAPILYDLMLEYPARAPKASVRCWAWRLLRWAGRRRRRSCWNPQRKVIGSPGVSAAGALRWTRPSGRAERISTATVLAQAALARDPDRSPPGLPRWEMHDWFVPVLFQEDRGDVRLLPEAGLPDPAEVDCRAPGSKLCFARHHFRRLPLGWANHVRLQTGEKLRRVTVVVDW